MQLFCTVRTAMVRADGDAGITVRTVQPPALWEYTQCPAPRRKASRTGSDLREWCSQQSGSEKSSKERKGCDRLSKQNSYRRPEQVSDRAAGAHASVTVKNVEQKTRDPLRQKKPGGTGQEIPSAEVILHAITDMTGEEPQPGRTRSNPIVYEAMELLTTYGYIPARLSEPLLPINIIGLKKSGSLLICALRSRLPVPSAAKLRELYTGKVDYLRGMAGRVKDRIMIWVYFPACGWRYYLVYPGGLRYDLDFPRSIE